MTRRRTLASQLERLRGFNEPVVEREQYPTDPEVAATLVHEAALRSDLERTVVDLGSGTGMLAIAASAHGADGVIGLEVDRRAVAIARENARLLGVAVDWLVGDVRHGPLCVPEPVTVVMNPPFGAQRHAHGSDRPFLELAGRLAAVSYSIHNAASRSFVEAFAAERGGRITHAYAVELDLPRQFTFHTEDVRSIEAGAYRIEWSDG